MIISFDIGIKNMAYCLMKNNDIIKWGVIDLCEKIPLCCHCGNESKFYDNQNYCGRHYKKSGKVKMPNIYKNIKKISYKKIKKICIEEDIDIEINKKKDELIEDIEKYKDEYFLHEIKRKASKDINMIDIGVRLKEYLDTNIKEYHIETVLIENQIGTIAIRMKTIQGMLSQYFIMNNLTNIHFVSSINKLKEFSLKKLTYTERKKKSIEITKSMIENTNKDWNEYFLKHKKKDDLSDSYLQLIWFINNASSIT